MRRQQRAAQRAAQISLQELKTHLRIEQEQVEEDAYLQTLLSTAQAAAHDFCLTDHPENPEPVRLAVLLMASHFFAHRENGDLSAYKAMRMAFVSLLWPCRDVTKLM